MDHLKNHICYVCDQKYNSAFSSDTLTSREHSKLQPVFFCSKKCMNYFEQLLVCQRCRWPWDLKIFQQKSYCNTPNPVFSCYDLAFLDTEENKHQQNVINKLSSKLDQQSIAAYSYIPLLAQGMRIIHQVCKDFQPSKKPLLTRLVQLFIRQYIHQTDDSQTPENPSAMLAKLPQNIDQNQYKLCTLLDYLISFYDLDNIFN